MAPRPLDHLVLPTADLAVARRRLEALGFIVAPEGVHPFGTKNACVYLADDSFLEALAIGDAAACADAAAAGNSFVLGDRDYRQARGDEGLSGLVFGTSDADVDHDEFARLGISGGPMVAFSRPALDRSGKADTASFLLAFAAPAGGADAFFFACERRRAPAIDRSALQSHANGATRIAAVHAQAADPASFAAFLATAGRGTAFARDGFVEVALANGVLRVFPAVEAARPNLTAIVFGVSDLRRTAAVLAGNGIVHESHEGPLTVPSTAGQGADFIFEETR